MEPLDDLFLDGLIGAGFQKEGAKKGYERRCPRCVALLRLDEDGVWACPEGHYRHP